MDRKRLRAFLLGGAAGLLAGVIFAPRSGRELRGSVADRAGEARERGRETLFEAQERLQEHRAAAREGYSRRPRPGSPGGPRLAPQTPEEPGAGVPLQPGLREEQELREEPGLRDLSRDLPGEAREAERSEELRRKVRETRARLRESSDALAEGEEEGRNPDDPGVRR